MEEWAAEEEAEGMEKSDEGLMGRFGGGPGGESESRPLLFEVLVVEGTFVCPPGSPPGVCPPPSGTTERRVLGSRGPLRAPGRGQACTSPCGAWTGPGGLHSVSWPTRKQFGRGGDGRGGQETER